MIYDHFNNILRYFPEGHPLTKAVDYIRQFDENHADGTFQIEGQDIFSIVKKYQTFEPEQKKYETHREYIDVQAMISGEEAMHVSLENDLQVDEDYNPDTDKIRFFPPQNYSTIWLRPGYFVILFPGDLHRADCIWQKKMPVRKITLKVHTHLL